VKNNDGGDALVADWRGCCLREEYTALKALKKEERTISRINRLARKNKRRKKKRGRRRGVGV